MVRGRPQGLLQGLGGRSDGPNNPMAILFSVPAYNTSKESEPFLMNKVYNWQSP